MRPLDRLWLLMLMLCIVGASFASTGRAYAETEAEMRQRFLDEQLKPAETMSCSASSNAILSYAEQLKEYNKTVRAQLAQQGIGVQAEQIIDDKPITKEMVAAYARGERDIFYKKSAPTQFSKPEQTLPGAETRIAQNGTVVPKELTLSDPQTTGQTLNAIANEAMSQATNTELDADGLPVAYSAFFDLNPSMRDQYRKAKALNIGPGPVIIDTSMALREIEKSRQERSFFAGLSSEDAAYTPQGVGPITEFFLRIRAALSRL